MYLWFLKQNFVLLFHSHSFNFKGYATWYKFDGNANGGGILLYIIEDIPSTSLISVIIKRFFVGTKSKEKRWFLCSPPPPPTPPKKTKNKLNSLYWKESQLEQTENFYSSVRFQWWTKWCHYEECLSNLPWQKYCQR